MAVGAAVGRGSDSSGKVCVCGCVCVCVSLSMLIQKIPNIRSQYDICVFVVANVDSR